MSKKIDRFPIWNPKGKTRYRIFDNLDIRDSFKAFRQSSSAFIKKKELRNYLHNKFINKCVHCDSKESLQIDHIDSVHFCFHNGLHFHCNTEINLQILCKSCNTSKLP